MEIKFYESADGQVPVRDFLDGLDIKMRQKMLRSIMALQEMGYSLRMPLSEFLEDGIFELRAQAGNNISRVLYFLHVWKSSGFDAWFHQENAENTGS